MNDNYFNEVGQYLSQLQALDRLFQEWGYSPTIVPMLDAYGPYEAIEETRLSQFFSVLDANREALLLRADSTLFLARAICKHLHKNILPLRLCYSNSVVRPSKELTHELWQSGIELIGVSGIEGDLEIIGLVQKALDSIAPSQYRIHIGSRKIVAQCILHFVPQAAEKELLRSFDALAQRDFAELASCTSADCARLLLSIMNPQEFETRKDEFSQYFTATGNGIEDATGNTATARSEGSAGVSGTISDATTTTDNTAYAYFQEFSGLINELSNIIDPDLIRCDFSELGSHNYYTNIVFSAYANGQASPVAQGGRYDSLMQYFGIDETAIGATIFPHILRDYIISYDDDNAIGSAIGKESIRQSEKKPSEKSIDKSKTQPEYHTKKNTAYE